MVLTEGAARKKLAEGLWSWYQQEKARRHLEAKILKPKPTTAQATIWDRMSDIDSKAVIRSSPVFEEVLGIGLDEKLVTPNGYANFKGMSDDLIPKMLKIAMDKGLIVP